MPILSRLAGVPGASVELLTFDRKVASPFGGPLPAAALLARLYGLTPSTGNGSDLEAALASADAKLRVAPSNARRILLVTDLLTRRALGAERFASLPLRSGALVHVATVAGGAPSLVRDDDSAWAKLPRRTGGLLWTASCPVALHDTDRVVFEEWVRPTRIEKITAAGLPPDAQVEPELREGTGFEHLGVASKALGQVTLQGELWSSPVRWSATPSGAENRRWAALVFGTSLYTSFTEDEQMKLAMLGGAVSPVTSYLAIEPGVRPSTEGLDWSGVGEGGGGWGAGIGLGRVGTIGHGGGGGPDRRQAFLEGELAGALRACGARADTSATVTLESTLAEIVDVGSVFLVPSRDPAVERCVAERLWTVRLGPEFKGEHDDWMLEAKR